MKIIEYNKQNMEQELGNLQKMLESWKNKKVEKPEINGSGDSHNKETIMLDKYESMYTMLLSLLTETIVFMRNIDLTYIDTDESLKNKMMSIDINQLEVESKPALSGASTGEIKNSR